jgi:transcriptional regulator of arginine metabolism
MIAKAKRQNLIKQILTEKQISSYDSLVKALSDHGIRVTQATLSRDFAEMGVIRAMTPDGPRYQMDEGETGRHIDRLLGYEVLAIRRNESMVVIHTLAGRAQGVARYIEQMHRPEIIGTLGGFCTVLVIPASVRQVRKVESIIRGMVLNQD